MKKPPDHPSFDFSEPPDPAVLARSYRAGLLEQIRRDHETLRLAEPPVAPGSYFYQQRIEKYRAAIRRLDESVPPTQAM